VIEKKQAAFAAWRFSEKIQSLPIGKNFRLEILTPATVRWAFDEWKTWHDAETHDPKLGIHFVDFSVSELPKGNESRFHISPD
jgi:hypothetical protein